MRELVAAHSSEDTHHGGKRETAVITGAHDQVPATEDTTLQETDAVARSLATEAPKADIPADETAKPKPRQKRLQV